MYRFSIQILCLAMLGICNSEVALGYHVVKVKVPSTNTWVSAQINEFGETVLFDVPQEFESTFRLVQIDGGLLGSQIDSDSCQSIQNQARLSVNARMPKDMREAAEFSVRGASSILIDVWGLPLTRRKEMTEAVQRAASELGLNLPHVYIINLPVMASLDMSLSWDEEAMSAIIDKKQSLQNQIDLIRDGVVAQSGFARGRLTALDLYCDLVMGKAQITVHHKMNMSTPLGEKLSIQQLSGLAAHLGSQAYKLQPNPWQRVENGLIVGFATGSFFSLNSIRLSNPMMVDAVNRIVDGETMIPKSIDSDGIRELFPELRAHGESSGIVKLKLEVK